MAAESVRATAHQVRMIALRFQVEAINQTVPVIALMQPIAGRLLWEPIGAWLPESDAD